MAPPATVMLDKSEVELKPNGDVVYVEPLQKIEESDTYLMRIPEGVPDDILTIAENFRHSNHPRKVNICVGAYRDADGKPWVLPTVREAELIMLQNNVTKEYAGIRGDPDFIECALELAYGETLDTKSVAAIQSLSGTGACRVAALFYAQFLPKGTRVYIPSPTWGNHIPIFVNSGLDVHRYRYYDYGKNSLDFDGMVEDITAAPAGSIILLHACAHNPTGCDPTLQQWKILSKKILAHNLRVFFDFAYQGFATGDMDKDASSLRLFVKDGHSLALAQSFAKNFGLYGERCGTLSFICPNEHSKDRVTSQLMSIARSIYSSPPIHGSNIVKTVLRDDSLRERYYKECASMADRVSRMRSKLVVKLREHGSQHDWSHVKNQIGMFAFTGMSGDMVDELTEKYSIFLTRDGRVSVAGLTEANIDYVARAIHDVTDGKRIWRNFSG